MSHYVPRRQTHSGENSSQYQSQESQWRKSETWTQFTRSRFRELWQVLLRLNPLLASGSGRWSSTLGTPATGGRSEGCLVERIQHLLPSVDHILREGKAPNTRPGDRFIYLMTQGSKTCTKSTSWMLDKIRLNLSMRRRKFWKFGSKNVIKVLFLPNWPFARST